MRILNIAISIIALATLLASCKSEGGASSEGMTPSGFKYTVDHDAPGASPAKGDWVTFSISVVTDSGKVLQEILDGPNMPSVQIPTPDAPKPPKGNPIVDVLENASIGDSITVVMPIDSLGGPNPQLQGVQYVEYVMNVKDIQSDADRKAKVEADRLAAEAVAGELRAREGDVAAMVKQTLADFKSGKVKATDKDGLKIIIHEEGNGKVVEVGNRASMQYYGVLKSNGDEFDNSFKAGRAFTFTVGRGEVITGWDKGIPGLKKGAKATLIIPFDMAYGEGGRPGIPGKSDLVFYIEVEDVN